jgi:hypothetical protein
MPNPPESPRWDGSIRESYLNHVTFVSPGLRNARFACNSLASSSCCTEMTCWLQSAARAGRRQTAREPTLEPALQVPDAKPVEVVRQG